MKLERKTDIKNQGNGQTFIITNDIINVKKNTNITKKKKNVKNKTMKLSKEQKNFLKGIPNKKARLEQKIQFKLQNEFEIAKISWVKMGEEGIEYKWYEHDILKSFKTNMDSINKEENLCKDTTWYETKLEDKFIPKENSLTKEALNDLTNPENNEKEAEKIISEMIKTNEFKSNHKNILNEFRIFGKAKVQKPPLGIKPKWFHDEQRLEEIQGAIGRYNDANFTVPNEWKVEAYGLSKINKSDIQEYKEKLESNKCDENYPQKEKLNELTNPEKILEEYNNIEVKNPFQDIIVPKTPNKVPKEFCVEITKDNIDCLSSIRKDFHGDFVSPLSLGNFLHSNSLFRYCMQSNYPTKSKILKEIVPTEEFLRYIGKEDLICKKDFYDSEKFEAGKYLCDEAGIWNNPKTAYPNHWNNVKSKIVGFSTHENPLEFDMLTNTYIINHIECLSINDIINSGVLIVESPLYQNLKKYLSELVSKKLKEQL